MEQLWALSAISVVAIALLTAAIMVVYGRMLPASAPVAVSAACVGVGVAVSAVAMLLLPLPIPLELRAPVAMLSGLAALLTSMVPRAFGLTARRSVLFCVIWAGAVFVPTAALSFTGLGPWGVHPIDQGGSLAINVATGAAALGVLLAAGSAAPRLRPPVIPRGFATIGVVVVGLAWIGWMAGAELAIDELTPGILLNGLLAAGGGVGGWLAVQYVRHQAITLSAVAAGVISGLVGLSAGAPLYAHVAAAVVGVLAGVAGSLFTLRRVADTRRQQWFIVGSHLIAGSVGLVTLALFANDLGFLFTGQYVFLRDQVICCILVTAWSMGVAALLWRALRPAPVTDLAESA